LEAASANQSLNVTPKYSLYTTNIYKNNLKSCLQQILTVPQAKSYYQAYGHCFVVGAKIKTGKLTWIRYDNGQMKATLDQDTADFKTKSFLPLSQSAVSTEDAWAKIKYEV
jgi:hypothetical protein